MYEIHVSQFPKSPQKVGGWHQVYKIIQCQAQKINELLPAHPYWVEVAKHEFSE